jgi:hypothetical protein
MSAMPTPAPELLRTLALIARRDQSITLELDDVVSDQVATFQFKSPIECERFLVDLIIGGHFIRWLEGRAL